VLDKCARLADTAYYRENTTSFIYRNPDIFSTGYFEASGKWLPLNRPEVTFAVNYQENFGLIARIFEKCYPVDPNFSLFAMMDAFDGEPGLAKLMGSQE
jgi:spore coat polysaccharide biosynthesis protein SpsF (cytidylyltransferase family)